MRRFDVHSADGTSLAVWADGAGTPLVDHLVLYEPSLGLRYPAGSIEAVKEAVAAGDMEAAGCTRARPVPCDRGANAAPGRLGNPADLSKATDQAADAIPDAQIRVLEEHAHMAHKTDPAMVARLIRQFVSS